MRERRISTYGAPPRMRSAGGPRMLVGVALVCGVGLLVVLALASRSGEQRPAQAARVPELRPTREGAVRSAVSALYRLTLPAVLDRKAFDASLRSLAAPSSAGQVRATFGATDPALIAAFAERPRLLRGAPLGYRIERYTTDAASVAIWNVAVAATRRYGVQVQWRTLVVDLAWTRSGWRVTGGSGRGGPGPARSVEGLAAAAATFEPLPHAQ